MDRGGEYGPHRGGGPASTASGVPRETYWSWDLAFPPDLRPRAPPSPRLSTLQNHSGDTLGQHNGGVTAAASSLRAPSPADRRRRGAGGAGRGPGTSPSPSPSPSPWSSRRAAPRRARTRRTPARPAASQTFDNFSHAARSKVCRRSHWAPAAAARAAAGAGASGGGGSRRPDFEAVRRSRPLGPAASRGGRRGGGGQLEFPRTGCEESDDRLVQPVFSAGGRRRPLGPEAASGLTAAAPR